MHDRDHEAEPEEPPRGAFLLLILFLVLLTFLWTNVYLQTWGRG